jgi:2-aminoadipate transaminase
MALPLSFAARMGRVPASFLDTLFSVSQDPSIISFAGGLPSSALIDVEGIRQAAHAVLDEEGRAALQYTTTDGYLPLRQYIAERYRRRLGIAASPDEIQIVNGSQQCLDLIAKILVNPGDCIGVESPGYLGAFEAFSLYEPSFAPVPLLDDGPDMAAFATMVSSRRPRFFYAVPNCQNPSGCTYSDAKRREIAGVLSGADAATVFYEDDAFGELFFDNRARAPVKKYLPDRTVMSGSFSKTVAPGLRTGWIFAPPEILQQFNIAKQAADLHSNLLSQMVLHRYLTTHDYDAHLRTVTAAYGANCRLMCELSDDLFPPALTHTVPEGGMFLAARLPPGMDSMELFRKGVLAKVGIMPGPPFFANGGGRDMFRLNFSNTDEEKIKEGMSRLARVIAGMM